MKLIDDKSILTQKETSTKGGGRRKSAFAEEEEGYMFVEEGFRIRFGNGEVIDFYADTSADKEGWMKVLSEVVGKGYAAGSGQVKAWTELVLRHERALGLRREGQAAPGGRPQSSGKDIEKTLSTAAAPKAQAPSTQPPAARPRHQHNNSQPEAARRAQTRREKAKSLIF